MLLAQTRALDQYTGGGFCNIVQTVNGDLYCFYGGSDQDLYMRKSTNRGASWGVSTAVAASITVTAIATWYDRWSDIAAGLIHVAVNDATNDDIYYITVNTESSDALSTFVAASTTLATSAAGGSFSICRAKGGNVYIYGVIDQGSEGLFVRLLNADVPNGAWTSRTFTETIAQADQLLLCPGFAADNQDIFGIFWDASADEISRYIYDDSANTWAETSIATSMVDQAVGTSFPNMNGAIDLTNSVFVVVAWNGVDTANADLKCWTVSETAITAKTDVVANGTDDQGLCAITIDTATGYWTVYYAGKSDGSENFLTLVNIYYKVSTDSGTTWGAETLLTTFSSDIAWLTAVPRFNGNLGAQVVAYHVDYTYGGNVDEILLNVGVTNRPNVQGMIGI